MTPANTSRPDRSEGVELVPCPVCEMPAEVERRDVLGSTSGLFEMIKIRCLERHWFYMPATSLTPYAVPG
jgi:hypothetical protein